MRFAGDASVFRCSPLRRSRAWHLVEAINEFLAGGGNAGWMQPQLTTPSPVRHQPAKRRGFNLVEAAIVLGIVGLVIGGIWVAAQQMTRNRTVSHTVEQVAWHVGQVRNAIRGTAQGMSWYLSAVGSNTTLEAMELVPVDWKYDSAKNGYWTTDGLLVSPSVQDSVNPSQKGIGIGFIFNQNQRWLCRLLLVRLSTMDWRNIIKIYGFSNMTQIYPFGGNMTTNTTLTAPIENSNAGVNTLCNASFFATNAPLVIILWGL